MAAPLRGGGKPIPTRPIVEPTFCFDKGLKAVAETCATPGPASAAWQLIHTGDGNRVTRVYTGGSTLTTYSFPSLPFGRGAGGSYELDQSGVVQADGSILVFATTTRKYYSFAGQTIAMSTTDTGIPGTVTLDYFYRSASILFCRSHNRR